jgi:hypothetical protein
VCGVTLEALCPDGSWRQADIARKKMLAAMKINQRGVIKVDGFIGRISLALDMDPL